MGSTVVWVGAGDGVAELDVVVSGIGLVLRSVNECRSRTGRTRRTAPPSPVCSIAPVDRSRFALRVRSAPTGLRRLDWCRRSRASRTTLDAFRAGVFDVLPSPVVLGISAR